MSDRTRRQVPSLQGPQTGEPVGHRCPGPTCWCGFRAVSSLATLLAFHTAQEKRLGPLQAVAQVNLWGTVVGAAQGDDWARTIRASCGSITGPLYVADDNLRDPLGSRYGVQALPMDSLAQFS